MNATFCAWLLATCLGQTTEPAPSPRPATITTINETEQSMGLIGISAAGVLSAAGAGGTTAVVPLPDVIRVTFASVSEPSPEAAGTLLLAAGGRLRGVAVRSDRLGLVFQSATALGEVKIEFDRLVAYIPPGPASDDAARKALVDELLASTAAQDQVYLATGDRVPGVIESLTREQVVVSGALGRGEYPAKDVVAVSFSRLGLKRAAPTGLYAAFTLTDGQAFSAQLLSLKDDVFSLVPEWSWSAEPTTSPAGAARPVEPPAPAPAPTPVTLQAAFVSAFRICNGRVVELADLEPAGVAYVPFFNRVLPMRRDRSVWGRPLTMQGREYSSGLGLAPRTTLVYRLDGRFERFEARVGLDDEIGAKGSPAVFQVRHDGRLVLDLTLKPGAGPERVAVPLAGVKELTLVVDFGPDALAASPPLGPAGQHVDLADARLIKKAD
jgi:hypothetical protein